MFFYYAKLKQSTNANLNHKDVADNKQFWRIARPLLSEKPKSNEKITIVDNRKITNEDENNAELLKSFFSKAVKNLKIPEFSDSNPLAVNIPQPIFKAILKYKNHPSNIAIKNAINGPGFCFFGVKVNNVFQEIKRLKARKGTLITDIPVKFLKENTDIILRYY